MKMFMCRLLLGSMLTLPASTVFAACDTADLTDANWRYLSIWVTTTSDSEAGSVTIPVSVDCRFRFARSGAVTVDSCSGSDIPDTFVEIFQGWTPVLGSACDFKGCIGAICHRGRLSRDKLTLNGIVKFGDETSQTRGSFSMVKR
jgi:hypothetical protein